MMKFIYKNYRKKANFLFIIIKKYITAILFSIFYYIEK